MKAKNNLWIIFGAVLVIAVIVSAVTAGITANTVKVYYNWRQNEIYTKAEVDNLLRNVRPAASINTITYTKSEIDAKLRNISVGNASANVYTKEEMDNMMNNFYTKAQIDEKFTILSGTLYYMIFYKKLNGNDYHDYFSLTTTPGYRYRASIIQNTVAGRNETTISYLNYSNPNMLWADICVRKIAGDICSVGNVNIQIGVIKYTAGKNESVELQIGGQASSFIPHVSS